MAGRLRFGTSGWDYDEWIGPFYRSASESKLAAYSRVFPTAEINSTFYRPPMPGMVRGWARYSPDGFVFAAKVPQTVTHDRRLDVEKGADGEAKAFTQLMAPLRDAGKLGPLLLQLPPSLRFQPPAVSRFLETLDASFLWAIEFRNRSWLRPEAFDLLKAHGVSYTIVDEPLLPPDVHLTAPVGYVRWHGHGADPWYDYRYTEAELQTWVPKVRQVAEQSSEVYGFFNNHYHGYAPENCLQVLEMLGPLTDEQLSAKRRLEAFRHGQTRVPPKGKTLTLEDFEPGRVATKEIEARLASFADAARIERGRRIEPAEVEVSREGDEIRARISDYVVIVDMVARTVTHDCEDWAKQIAAKRMCKHVVRFVLGLPAPEARRLLDDVAAHRDGWRFRLPEA